MRIYNKGKSIDIPVRKVGSFSPGLMFRSMKTDNLLFEFSSDSKVSITSNFVFFPFLAIWLDSMDRVIGYERVRPFRFRIPSKKSFRKLVEVPLNSKGLKIEKMLVDERKV